ncbi:MAG: hypothetical protein IJ008_03545 [Clostridia bacterium]|nr:hypothetical protein [Clostridia bacterium]
MRYSTKRIWGTVFLFIGIIILSLIITSLVLASIHENSLVSEWKSWFGLMKLVKEPVVSLMLKK